MRFYPVLGADERAQLNRPWRELRATVLTLFAIPDSLTGATFARLQRKEGSS